MALSLSPLPPGFIVPCLPTPSVGCKSGPAWVHEIKHDGYRLIARRTDDRVRLYTRRGFNWADRYPRIVEALRFLRVRSITIDGEAVWCSRDGRATRRLHHRRVPSRRRRCIRPRPWPTRRRRWCMRHRPSPMPRPLPPSAGHRRLRPCMRRHPRHRGDHTRVTDFFIDLLIFVSW